MVTIVAPVRRYHVTTFGCQMNAHDSERIKGMLEELGLGETSSPDEADVLVFNTCTIREKADTRLRRAPRERERAEGARSGARDRGRRVLLGVAGRADLRPVPLRRRRVRARLDLAPRRVARGRGTGVPRSSFGIADRRFAADLPVHRERRFRPGCRSRWAATRSLRLLHRSRSARPRGQPSPGARSSPRSNASPPTASTS